MKNNIIHVDFKKIEQAEDHNCEAIAWGQNEHHKLHAIKSKLCRIDMMDGILGNEPTLLDCIRSVEEAIQINTRQKIMINQNKKYLMNLCLLTRHKKKNPLFKGFSKTKKE